MGDFSWIQFSDLNFNTRDSFDINLVRKSLLDCLMQENFKCDYIFITGDIADRCNYETTNTFISEILNRINHKDVFWAAGNHDIKRGLDYRSNAIQKIRTTDNPSHAFELAMSDDVVRDILTRTGMSDYIKQYENVFHRQLSTEEIYNAHIYYQLEHCNLVVLNTCLTSCDDNDANNLMIIEPRLLQIFNKISDKDRPLIVIGHHDKEFFHYSERKKLAILFEDMGVDLYLCGHSHQLGYSLFEDAGRNIPQITCGRSMDINDDGGTFSFMVGEYISDSHSIRITPYTYYGHDIKRFQKNYKLHRRLTELNNTFILNRLDSSIPAFYTINNEISNNTNNKRFKIAISFPVVYRNLVEGIAEKLSERFGKEKILYDKYHHDEFERPNHDIYLQKLYWNESDLIIVFICANYQHKKWNGIEWRDIRDLMNQRDCNNKIIFIKCGKGAINDISDTINDFIDSNKASIDDIVSYIEKRYYILNNMDLFECSKRYYDFLFSEKGQFRFLEIDELLFPNIKLIDMYLHRENDKQSHKLMHVLMECKDNILIIGDGGMGKTTMLLHIWDIWLKNRTGELPLYVPLKDYKPQQEFIREYIKQYYGLIDVHSLEHKFLMLIDGFNEITRDSVYSIIYEINNLITQQSDNIRIVITSRDEFFAEHQMPKFMVYYLQPLDDIAIHSFLSKYNLKLSNTLFEIMRTPIMLTLYTQTSSLQKQIKQLNLFDLKPNNTIGELLYNYMLCQVADCIIKFRYEDVITTWYTIFFVVPYIAYEMEKSNIFSINKEHLSHLLVDFKHKKSLEEIITDLPPKFKEWIIKHKLTMNITTSVEDILFYRQYFLKKSDRYYMFLHHSLRNFFSAVHIANVIRNSLMTESFIIPPEVSERVWSIDIRKMLGNYYSDYYHSRAYDPNHNTPLHELLNQLRGLSYTECGYAVNNIIETWRDARGSRIVGEDLTRLDLSNVILGGIIFSDNEGDSNFEKSDLSNANLNSQGHSDNVTSVMYSENERYVLSASLDRTIKEWDRETGQCTCTFNGHSNGVTSAVFNKDGQYVLSASSDGTIKEWNRETGECLRTFVDHSSVNSVVYSKDGQYVLSASSDGAIKEWNRETGECLLTFIENSSVNSVVYSKDGKCVLSASSDGTIKEWNRETGKCLSIFANEGHSKYINSAVYSEDGLFILSASADYTINEWDRETGIRMRMFEGHSDSVNTAIYSKDGQRILSASSDGTIKEWDRKTSECLYTFEGHSGSATSVMYSEDGIHILSASADKSIKEWNRNTGECLWTFNGYSNIVDNYAMEAQINIDVDSFDHNLIESMISYFLNKNIIKASEIYIQISRNTAYNAILKELFFIKNFFNNSESEEDMLIKIRLWNKFSKHDFNNLEINNEFLKEHNVKFDPKINNSATTNVNDIQNNAPQKANKKYSSNQVKGEVLEKATVTLLKELFRPVENDISLIEKLRKQKSGNQFGFDIEFQYYTEQNNIVECRIECKNYTDTIPFKEISVKVHQLQRDNSKFEHFIIISPHANPDNELNMMIKYWNADPSIYFYTQIWSPDTNVEEFLGLHSEIYNEFYKKSKKHPDNWKSEYKNKIIDKYKKLLYPRIRLPKSWLEYLNELPSKLLFKNEAALNYPELYNVYVDLKAIDEHGTKLPESLTDYVYNWLNKNSKKSLIVLGEFGDGKSFFTYYLSRKLADDYKKDSSSGWIPLRFSLQDYVNEAVSDVETFLKRRLEHFKADVSSLIEVVGKKNKLLIILDGFDEMSKKIDTKSILENSEKLINCYDYFIEYSSENIKFLITSRKGFFIENEYKDNIKARIDMPNVVELDTIPRKQAFSHLIISAENDETKEKIKKLQYVHDPIGLATKPLFLSMLKEIINDIDEDCLNVVGIYNKFISKSLSRKFDGIEKNKLDNPRDIKANMIKILKNISLELYKLNSDSISLFRFFAMESYKEAATLLWDLSNPNEIENDDASNRILHRSLLIRTANSGENNKEVKFCHRSMGEFFVAQAVCDMLCSDNNECSDFLKECDLNDEMVFFITQLLLGNNEVYKNKIIKLLHETKNRVGDEKYTRLGRNAINILYAMCKELPGEDYSFLTIDKANLQGANLSSKNFSGTSLRDAKLYNVSFNESNFIGSDLTGALFDETYKIISIVNCGKYIYALYDDNSIWRWDIHTERPENILTETYGNKLKFIVLSQNRIITLEKNKKVYLVFYIKGKIEGHFEVNDTFSIISFNNLRQGILYSQEIGNNMQYMEYQLLEGKSRKSILLSQIAIYCMINDKGFITYSDKTLNTYIDDICINKEICDVLCITTYELDKCNFLIGIGCKSGIVTLLILIYSNNKWKLKEYKNFSCYNENINNIVFVSNLTNDISDVAIAISDIIGNIYIIKLNENDILNYNPSPLRIKISCENMKIEGLKSEREYNKLNQVINR